MGPTANFHEGKAVAGLLSAEWDAVVTTHKPTRGTGVVLPKQLLGPDRGDPPIRFVLAGFSVSRDWHEQVQRCESCHQIDGACRRGSWWLCSLYLADMAQAQQVKRAQERRPKLLTVDDLFMDLEEVKAAEDLQEVQEGWWQQDESQEWQQPRREGGEDRVDWSQQQTNEFAGSRTGRPDGEWHSSEGRQQEERRSDPPHQRGSNNGRSRRSKRGRRNW